MQCLWFPCLRDQDIGNGSFNLFLVIQIVVRMGEAKPLLGRDGRLELSDSSRNFCSASGGRRGDEDLFSNFSIVFSPTASQLPMINGTDGGDDGQSRAKASDPPLFRDIATLVASRKMQSIK